MTTVPAISLRDALSACLLSVEKAGYLPILNAVKVTRRGAVLEVQSTDRYRLTRVRIPMEAGADLDAIVPAADVKRLIANLPKKPARFGVEPTATLTVEGGRLALGTEDGTVTAQLLNGEFPKLESIIDGAVNVSDPAGAAAIGFNPAFMVDLCKMPGRAKGQPVRLAITDAKKPLVATWESGAVEFLHLLMPVRLTD